MGINYENIKEKRIVIWGIGILQTDLEGLYSFSNVLYYVDDCISDRSLISVPREHVYGSERLKQENKDDIIVVLCLDDQDDAISKLKTMGFDEENYILGEELLINQALYQDIHSKEVSIWGTGNTYFYNEVEIQKYLPKVANFVVSEKKDDNFQGRDIFTLESLLSQLKNPYIVVASIYYNEIYATLISKGLKPGKDFIHLYTLVSLGNLSTRIQAEYKFDDRSKKSKDLLVILSGYKDFVWESVFPRLREYAPNDMDVCVVTSGLKNERLKEMCSRYNWSYMSTVQNHVSLVVNLAIQLHPEAKYIYKIDEDIFVTEGVFETLKSTYLKAGSESKYEIGFVTPLIPVNGYGYVRLLEIFKSVHLWEERFGELKYTDCYHHHRAIHDNPEAARFMWGDRNITMSNIDDMQKQLQQREFQYSICPIRYSIGFILFHRDNWIRMGMFPVLSHSNMGSDEEHFCKFCLMQARAMVVSENSIVGHLSYGPQHKVMEKYYKNNKNKFLLPQKG
ncbi:MAG: hypothetical protein KIC73_14325 [Clostridiales bacterium]|nr:hypothetical protein [Clostridiales bacterium]